MLKKLVLLSAFIFASGLASASVELDQIEEAVKTTNFYTALKPTSINNLDVMLWPAAVQNGLSNEISKLNLTADHGDIKNWSLSYIDKEYGETSYAATLTSSGSGTVTVPEGKVFIAIYFYRGGSFWPNEIAEFRYFFIDESGRALRTGVAE